MKTKENIKLPAQHLDGIKKQIDTNKDNAEKPQGFGELAQLYATGEISPGQAAKIKSFYDNFEPSDPEQKEKWDMYGGNQLRAFVDNSLTSIKTKKDNAMKVRQMTSYPMKGSQTDRTVDRQNSRTLASTEPTEPPTMNRALREEIDRIKTIMMFYYS